MLDRLASTGHLSSAATMLVLALAALAPRVTHAPADRQVDTPATIETTASVPVPNLQPRARIPVDVLRVIDGDTVEVRAHIWLDQQVQARIRLRGIDAPELKATCGREAALAEAARDALAVLLAGGKAWLGDVGRDKFGGRFLGAVYDQEGRDVSQRMLSLGHVRSYDGRKRQSWC